MYGTKVKLLGSTQNQASCILCCKIPSLPDAIQNPSTARICHAHVYTVTYMTLDALHETQSQHSDPAPPPHTSVPRPASLPPTALRPVCTPPVPGPAAPAPLRNALPPGPRSLLRKPSSPGSGSNPRAAARGRRRRNLRAGRRFQGRTLAPMRAPPSAPEQPGAQTTNGNGQADFRSSLLFQEQRPKRMLDGHSSAQ